MKRIIDCVVMLCLCVGVQAQELQKQGRGVEDLVPKGWEHTEATGDLNKDGIADLVVVATPDFKENTKTRDDGYVYNFNQPLLAVYFGTAEGKMQLWRQYDQVIPARTDEFLSIDASLTITEKGVLRISLETFSSMGGWSSDNCNFSYRYQDGDFYLIGQESQSLARNTGEMETTSENYLTWRRQVVTENVFEDNNVPRKEKWTKLPKKLLEKLGKPLQ
ncbi:MAG: FG-GAP repeat protein [Paludibacteraceae bacterium]|nr:FG-GAP repeat protein [Paludibacteraceae bacterium]